MAGPLDRNPLDVDYPRALLVALGLVLAAALVVAAGTSSAAFGAYNPSWDGASDLRAEADALGTDSEVVLNASDYGSVAADGTTALVLSPARPYGDRDAARLRRFVEDGGTLVVAEDFGNHSNALLRDVGADTRVTGAPLRDERHNYRSPAMPVAGNVSDYPLLTGVDAFTLNHGTTLEPGNATVVVRSSGFAYLDTNRNGELDDDESIGAYPVATVEHIGDGRVIVVSDPSVFINAMIDRPGNQQFVWNLLGAHDRALFDYSHAERLPPLAHVVLVVRKAPLLQAMLGLLGLAAVGAWGRGTFAPLRARLAAVAGRDRPDRERVDREALAAYLRREHPDWDDARARRVTEGVIKDHDEGRSDD